jgi:hypothetical protein
MDGVGTALGTRLCELHKANRKPSIPETSVPKVREGLDLADKDRDSSRLHLDGFLWLDFFLQFHSTQAGW